MHFPRGMGAIDSVIHGPHQLFGVLRNCPNVPPEWTNHIGHCSHFSGWEPVIAWCRLFSFSARDLSREFFFCALGLWTTFDLFVFPIPSVYFGTNVASHQILFLWCLNLAVGDHLGVYLSPLQGLPTKRIQISCCVLLFLQTRQIKHFI